MTRSLPVTGFFFAAAACAVLSLNAAGQAPETGGTRAAQAPAQDKSGEQPALQENAQRGTAAPGSSPGAAPGQKGPAKGQSGAGAKAGTKGAAGGKDSARRKNLDDCFAAYDPATNMTRREWAATCRRTLREYPEIR